VKVLVTGSTGFLGGRLIDYFLAAGHEVIALGADRYTCVTGNNVSSPVVIDWTNRCELRTICQQVGAVIHAAGPNASDCLSRLTSAVTFHDRYTRPLLEACKLANVARFFFLSSVHVYSSRFLGSYDEESLTLNDHPYAQMKIDGEKMVAAYRERGFHYFNLRLSNVIGYPVTPRIKAWDLVANNYALQLAYSNKVTIKSEKSSTRDFLPMSDFLNAIDLLVNLKKVPQDFTFNVCSASCTSVADLASLFVEQWYELTGQRSKLTFLKNKDKNDHCSSQFLIKNDRLRRLNFSNSGSIEEEVGALLLKVWEWKHQGVLP
tara:strand:- start:2634 stop:3590 length:957 start_codon:yes stop_codon:yes gene_type:complete